MGLLKKKKITACSSCINEGGAEQRASLFTASQPAEISCSELLEPQFTDLPSQANAIYSDGSFATWKSSGSVLVVIKMEGLEQSGGTEVGITLAFRRKHLRFIKKICLCVWGVRLDVK